MADIKELLAELQAQTIEELLARIKDKTATAADLGVARALLKDNAITSVPTPDSPLQSLVENLPFTGDNSSPYAN